MNKILQMSLCAYTAYCLEVSSDTTTEYLREIALSEEIQLRNKNWKTLLSKEERAEEEKRLMQECQQHDIHLLIGMDGFVNPFTSEIVPVPLLLDTPGVAMIAAYLTVKKGLSNLFVCTSVEAMLNQVQRIVDKEGDQRCSLILSTMGYHKEALFFEKTEKEIKISWMESIPTKEEGAPGGFCIPVVLLEMAKLYRSKGFSVELFYSGVQRLSSDYGCGVFALQDSISFLQDPDFFVRIYSEDAIDGVHVLLDLPPEYMIGTQSLQVIENYKTSHLEEIMTHPMPGRRKNFEEYLEKYNLLNGEKKQNHYITKKHFQYMNLVIEAAKILPPDEIQRLIQTTLVTQ